MTSPVEDVSSLPGKKVLDQSGREIGEIKDIYTHGEDGEASWVTVEAKTGGFGSNRKVFIPLARLKQEGDDIGVPYSSDHVKNAPEIEDDDQLSDEDERNLRDHYGIDRADQELRSDHHSYATLVPEEEGTASKADDPEQVETPEADKVDEDTKERLQDPGSSEIRHVSFGDDNEGGGGGGEGSGESSGSSGESSEDSGESSGSSGESSKDSGESSGSSGENGEKG
jgi:sporulation protein YlmC with PRC-barrel domain